VRANLESTGYPEERIHFVEGKVEDTIPGDAAGADRAAPPRHRLVRVDPARAAPSSIRCSSRHGILVIDDYGHWQGARQAVDEYFAARPEPVYLHRVDYTARLVVKQDAA
jgi:hypothetical protein